MNDSNTLTRVATTARYVICVRREIILPHAASNLVWIMYASHKLMNAAYSYEYPIITNGITDNVELVHIHTYRSVVCG